MIRQRRIYGYDITRVLLGLLLLAAAGLKAHQLATEPVAGRDVLTSRWFLAGWVEFEVILGLWLLSGVHARTAWLFALACFSVFSVVTLYKGLLGEASCGCFGRVEVNPWYTLVLDVGAVAALLTFRPNLQVALRPRYRWARLVTAAGLAAAAGLATGVAMATYTPARLLADGAIAGDDPFVVLKLESWVGKPCPLLKHIDIGGRLAKGEWTVLLYHHDCPQCRTALPRYREKARELAREKSAARVALVEIPPYAPPGQSPVSPGSDYALGRLNETRKWFLATPGVLVLDDGTVLKATEGETAEPPDPRWWVHLASTTEATLEADSQGVYDYGFVEPGARRTAWLSVTNSRGKSVAVRRVRSECPCLKAAVPEGALPPGTSSAVLALFIAPKKAIHYDKRILLETDDPSCPTMSLRFRADVGLPLEVQPSVLDLGALAARQKREQTVTIRNRCKEPVRLLYSTSDAAGCFATVPREPIPAMGYLRIPVVVSAQGSGRRTVRVRIRTDLDLQPCVTVPVRFSVGGESSGSPSRVGLEPAGAAEAEPATAVARKDRAQ